MLQVLIVTLLVLESLGHLDRKSKVFPHMGRVLGLQPFDKVIIDTVYTTNQKDEQQELDIISKNFHSKKFFDKNEQTVLVVKTVRHRNKRYSSYFSYCPFKICKFGRQRRTRSLF